METIVRSSPSSSWSKKKMDFMSHYMDEKEVQEILKDFENTVKRGHWIWYTFPQLYGSWGRDVTPSENTLNFSLTYDEIFMFLKDGELLPIYSNFIISFTNKMIEKVDSSSDYLHVVHNYFGDLDFLKFKDHIVPFLATLIYITKRDHEKDRTFGDLYKVLAYNVIYLNALE